MKPKKVFFAILSIAFLHLTGFLATFSSAAAQISTAILPEAELVVTKLSQPLETGYLKVAADAYKKPTNKSYVRFNLNTIPSGATITGCSLQFVTAEELSSETNVLLFKASDDWKDLSRLGPEGPQLAAKIVAPGKEKSPVTINQTKELCEVIDKANKDPADTISFQLSTDRRNARLSFYSTESKDPVLGVIDPSYRPRLLLSYIPPDASVTPLDWSQLHHDAQHTGRSPWRIYNGDGKYFPEKVRVRSVFSAKYIYPGPIIYRDNLYTFVQADDSKYCLRATDRWGKKIWEVAVDDVPKPVPAVNRFGRLYYVTENQVHTYDLENKGAIGDHPSDIREKDTVLSPPTLGPDGSLYLVTNPYVYAYSPYPQHQLLWSYRHGHDKVSSVVLGEDGKTAYIVDGTEGKVIALNSWDGTEKWKPLRGLQMNVKLNDPVPIPVVAEDHVYITSGFPTGGTLYIVHDEQVTASLISPIKGSAISTPVVGPDQKIYFVKDGELWSYREDKKETKLSDIAGSLGAVSNTVMDGSGNIYCWNKDTKWLYAFDGKGRKLCSQSLQSANLGPNLLIAPDGNLYNYSSNVLQAIVPAGDQLTLDSEMVRQGNNTVFRAAEHIDVTKDLVVERGKSIILFSGHTIGLKPGFKVKKGARVICKTGF